jgi:hypothetical protein
MEIFGEFAAVPPSPWQTAVRSAVEKSAKGKNFLNFSGRRKAMGQYIFTPAGEQAGKRVF